MSSLNPPEEVELAEKLIEIHPWAGQARFTRSGGKSMAVAVRIARATTGRSKVTVSGYHGWFSKMKIQYYADAVYSVDVG